MHGQCRVPRNHRDRQCKKVSLTIRSFGISRAYSRRITFSKISMGKSRRPNGGLPAVIQVGGARAWTVFAARPLHLSRCQVLYQDRCLGELNPVWALKVEHLNARE